MSGLLFYSKYNYYICNKNGTDNERTGNKQSIYRR